MTTTETKLITADELLQLYSKGVRGELIRGVLCETMPTGQEHGEIVMRLGYRLMAFIDPRKLGRLTASDAGCLAGAGPGHGAGAGHRLLLGGEDTAGREGYGLCRDRSRPSGGDRIPQATVVERSTTRPHMWLGFGVHLVWVVNPDTRTVDVHRQGRGGNEAHRERPAGRPGGSARLHLFGE